MIIVYVSNAFYDRDTSLAIGNAAIAIDYFAELMAEIKIEQAADRKRLLQTSRGLNLHPHCPSPFIKKRVYRKCMRCNRYEDHGDEKSPSAGNQWACKGKPTL